MFFCLISSVLFGCDQQNDVFDGGERYERSGLVINDKETKVEIKKEPPEIRKYLTWSYWDKSNYSMDQNNIYCNWRKISPNYWVFKLLSWNDKLRTDEISVYDNNCELISDDFSWFKIINDNYYKDSSNVWYFIWDNAQ